MKTRCATCAGRSTTVGAGCSFGRIRQSMSRPCRRPSVDMKDLDKSIATNLRATSFLIGMVDPLLRAGEGNRAVLRRSGGVEPLFGHLWRHQDRADATGAQLAGRGGKDRPARGVATPAPMPTATRARHYPARTGRGWRTQGPRRRGSSRRFDRGADRIFAENSCVCQPSNAVARACHSTSTGSIPTDRRMKPSGTASPQRARRSPAVWVPPKLVDCAM